jgi:hypothetical protein
MSKSISEEMTLKSVLDVWKLFNKRSTIKLHRYLKPFGNDNRYLRKLYNLNDPKTSYYNTSSSVELIDCENIEKDYAPITVLPVDSIIRYYDSVDVGTSNNREYVTNCCIVKLQGLDVGEIQVKETAEEVKKIIDKANDTSNKDFLDNIRKLCENISTNDQTTSLT